MPFVPTRLLATLFVGTIGAVVAAQDAVFRSGVDLVTVDATVLGRDGRPIDWLGADDFRIEIDGKPRRVVSAQFVSSAAPANRQGPLPAYHFSSNEHFDAGRLVMVAVDEAHIRRLEGRSALEAAAEFIDRLDPLDRIAVTGLTSVGVVEFTRNRVALKRRLSRLVGQTDPVFHQFNIGLAEAIDVADGSRVRLGDAVLRECGRSLTEYRNLARAGDEAAGGERDACPEQVEQEARVIAQHARTQARISLSALESLVATLKQIEGSKTVVLLSEGMLANPRDLDMSELSAAAQAARVTIYVLHLETPIFEASQDRVSPTFVQDLHVRGDGLSRLAGAGRGAVFRLVGSDPAPFERIATEMSGYYLLAFEPLSTERDDRVHRISVKLAKGGGELRSRQAFKLPVVAPTARAREADLVELLRASYAVTELPVRVATYTYFEPDSPNMRVVVSTEAQAAAGPAARVLLGYVLLDAQGIIAASGATSADGGRHAFSTLVPPGDYTLRVAGIDPLGRRGLVSRPFGAQVTGGDTVRVSDLILAPVPAREDALLQPLVDRVGDASLTMYLELYANDGSVLRGAAVTFEVAADEGTAAQLSAPATVHRRDARWSVARAIVALDSLQPGGYLARAQIVLPGGEVMRVVRPFTFLPPTSARDHLR
jgi:VWFA-related protein